MSWAELSNSKKRGWSCWYKGIYETFFRGEAEFIRVLNYEESEGF